MADGTDNEGFSEEPLEKHSLLNPYGRLWKKTPTTTFDVSSNEHDGISKLIAAKQQHREHLVAIADTLTKITDISGADASLIDSALPPWNLSPVRSQGGAREDSQQVLAFLHEMLQTLHSSQEHLRQLEAGVDQLTHPQPVHQTEAPPV
uniref:Uncharacterized protein n=1 Tax=Timema tahoe TaxID=61484 RepID=A0A7R9IN84_9NEOP|nr:unnamed protein product [Timema tahoe]